MGGQTQASGRLFWEEAILMSTLHEVPRTAEAWRETVLAFEAARSYEDPIRGCAIEATFAGPQGQAIVRPAFWDGGRRYCVSFAAPVPGRWTWTLRASRDSGLYGEGGILDIVPYSGSLAIFSHGFVRVARPDEGFARKLLVHADGTPFFWLGDTHWEFAFGESWDKSNHPGMASQFRGMVDRRVQQGFTVYQTNLRSDFGDHSRFWLTGPDDPCPIPNPAIFQQEIDRRMRYVAEHGLVNVLGFAWGFSMGTRTTVAEQETLACYCVARYGALPVIWSIAGEAAGYDADRRAFQIDSWRKVAEATVEADRHLHPCTVHYTNERPFADYYYGEPWFDFVLNQGGHGDYVIAEADYRDYFATHSEKPFIEGEAFYEGCSSLEENGSRRIDAAMLRRVAYMSLMLGGAGYTYGAQGIWDNVWDAKDLDATSMGQMMRETFNRYGVTWAEGIDLPGAEQMGMMRRFFEGHRWWDLEPISAAGSVVLGRKRPLAAATQDDTCIVAYYSAQARKPLELEGRSGVWQASWFDPRGGAVQEAGTIECEGSLVLPRRPTLDDWVLVLEKRSQR